MLPSPQSEQNPLGWKKKKWVKAHFFSKIQKVKITARAFMREKTVHYSFFELKVKEDH